MQKLCLIYNTAPKYREAIFQAIDAEYDCDWYFGKTKSDIKEMDTSLLKNVTYYNSIGNPNKLYWKCGVLHLLFKKKYNNFFMLAEFRSIVDWLFFWVYSTFFKNKKVYIWTHGWYGKETGIDAKMKLWLYRHVAGTFVYGDRAKELLVKQGIPNEKLFVIRNSLDYDRQMEIRKKIQPSDIYRNYFENDNPTIIFIGRLTKIKRLDMLINALSELNLTGHKYNLIFVGDGSEKQALQNLTSSRGVERQVWFYGECYDEIENASLIYNADLCVAPGNVGLTAIHSMVFGTPVISHNDYKWQMPEFEAIRPGLTGDFFVKDDLASLEYVILNWFNTKHLHRNTVRQACYNEIDTNWNPHYQMEVIKKNLHLI